MKKRMHATVSSFSCSDSEILTHRQTDRQTHTYIYIYICIYIYI